MVARRSTAGPRRARRINVTVAADTHEMLVAAAAIEDISVAQYLREGGIMRAGFSFAEATHAADYADLAARIAAIEQHLGIDPPSP